MPADENQEGIPNSILEAMATGMPVLATRHGGIPEAVEDGRCGALVEERDYQALAAEMKKITRTPHTFGEMGVLASESVAANFEQRLHVAQLEGHYREAAEIGSEAEARAGSDAGGRAPVPAGTRACQIAALSDRFLAGFSPRKKTPESCLSALAKCSSVCASLAALRRSPVPSGTGRA